MPRRNRIDLARAAAEPPTARRLPRWRGFNLLEKFVKRGENNPPFEEQDSP